MKNWNLLKTEISQHWFLHVLGNFFGFVKNLWFYAFWILEMKQPSLLLFFILFLKKNSEPSIPVL
jgi:hypothetical protein